MLGLENLFTDSRGLFGKEKIVGGFRPSMTCRGHIDSMVSGLKEQMETLNEVLTEQDKFVGA